MFLETFTQNDANLSFHIASFPSGKGRTKAMTISNEICEQKKSGENYKSLSLHFFNACKRQQWTSQYFALVDVLNLVAFYLYSFKRPHHVTDISFIITPLTVGFTPGEKAFYE